MSSDKATWVWMPHAAHLIVAKWCQFHLATCVGDFIVSTVGEYFPERAVREIFAESRDHSWLTENRHLRGDNFDAAYMKRFGYEEVGCDRRYESYVFPAGPSHLVPPCCQFTPKDWGEIDSLPANDAATAIANHMALCEKYADWKEGQHE